MGFFQLRPLARAVARVLKIRRHQQSRKSGALDLCLLLPCASSIEHILCAGCGGDLTYINGRQNNAPYSDSAPRAETPPKLYGRKRPHLERIRRAPE
jgi:hypothetical protein